MDLHYFSFYPCHAQSLSENNPWETWLYGQCGCGTRMADSGVIRQVCSQQRAIRAHFQSPCGHSSLLTSLWKCCPLEFCEAQHLRVSWLLNTYCTSSPLSSNSDNSIPSLFSTHKTCFLLHWKNKYNKKGTSSCYPMCILLFFLAYNKGQLLRLGSPTTSCLPRSKLQKFSLSLSSASISLLY